MTLHYVIQKDGACDLVLPPWGTAVEPGLNSLELRNLPETKFQLQSAFIAEHFFSKTLQRCMMNFLHALGIIAALLCS